MTSGQLTTGLMASGRQIHDLNKIRHLQFAFEGFDVGDLVSLQVDQ